MPVGAAHAVGPREPPVLPRTVGDVLRDACAAAPDRLAVVEGTPDASTRVRLSYAELLEQAERCARALLRRYEPGDHVAIWAPNLARYQVLQYGVPSPAWCWSRSTRPCAGRRRATCSGTRGPSLLHGRGLPRPRAPRAALDLAAELDTLRDVQRLDDWDAFLAGGDASAALPAVAPEDPAQILYTSGTTGSPKGAVLPHVGMANNAAHAALRITAGRHPPVWLAVPADVPPRELRRRHDRHGRRCTARS